MNIDEFIKVIIGMCGAYKYNNSNNDNSKYNNNNERMLTSSLV